jgi:hypothetical protein
MAMPADRIIYVSAVTTGITDKAYKITIKNKLHGTMTVAYVIVIHSAIMVPSVVRIERVFKVADPGGGFKRVRQKIVTIILSLGTARLITKRS